MTSTIITSSNLRKTLHPCHPGNPVDRPRPRQVCRLCWDEAPSVRLAIPTIEDLGDAARRMEKIGISHGDVTKLPALGIAILSFQDPDDINLELVTLLDR
jgi:hypothetical protein